MEEIKRRRIATLNRLAKLREMLSNAAERANGKACIYVTGSYGRGEASEFSDLDAFIVGRENEGRRTLSRLDEICIKADLIVSLKNLEIKEFDGDGKYLVHYTADQLATSIGKSTDDSDNTLSARLLMLLESKPIIGKDVYDEAISDIISAYWRDYEDHKLNFIPAYFCNDILRLWRTFCVNYEARSETSPPEKKYKRRVKNFKLKFSRMLTCYSVLLELLGAHGARGTLSPDEAIEIAERSPTDRLEYLLQDTAYAAAHDKLFELLTLYNGFLETTAVPEERLVEQFSDKNNYRAALETAEKFGDQLYQALLTIGERSRLLRLLVV
ncbi:MAG: nucleotidyltransferase domain-containing protein [Rhodovulum sp.]|nr:nucleotidyltransferase domain-containing protein [Rhodovulum sp.]